MVAGAGSTPRGPSSGATISTSRAVIPQVNPVELGCDPAQVGIMVFSAKAVQVGLEIRISQSELHGSVLWWPAKAIVECRSATACLGAVVAYHGLVGPHKLWHADIVKGMFPWCAQLLQPFRCLAHVTCGLHLITCPLRLIMRLSLCSLQRYGRVWQLGDMIGISGREGVEKFYTRKLVGRAQIAAASQTLKDVIWEYKVGAKTSACKRGCTRLGLALMK